MVLLVSYWVYWDDVDMCWSIMYISVYFSLNEKIAVCKMQWKMIEPTKMRILIWKKSLRMVHLWFTDNIFDI